MCIFRKWKAKSSYPSTLNLIENNNLAMLRKRTKILIVDDESDDIYQILKERQYDAYYKNDMTYSIEAEPFEIVIMDIRGVAARLQSSMEGFSLACEVKARYPFKRVCCYSGSVYKKISSELADHKIDAFFVKDMDIDSLCQKIDHLIQSYADPKSQWEIFRKELQKNQVSEEDINKIREAYETGLSTGNVSPFNDILIRFVKNGTVIINMTNAVLSLLKVLVVA